MQEEHKAISLRNVETGDHNWLVLLHNDPLVLHNLTNPSKIDLVHHLEWWKNKGRNKIRKVCMLGIERIGFCKFDFDYENNSCVLGADIYKDFRGKGLATPMWEKMLEFCKKEGIYRVSLTTAEYNEIAQKVYKKLGFIEEGRFVKSLKRDGQYFDQILMYKILDE